MMDRTSPIYAALVSQTEATIKDFKFRIELMKSGRFFAGTGERDETAEWVTWLEKSLTENEKLLTMLRDGTI